MTGHTDLTKDVDIDVKGLFSHIWQRKWRIIVISLMVGAAVFFLFSQVSPRFQSVAQILIEPRESVFTRARQQTPIQNGNQFDTAAILSQVQIILSDEIATGTIKKLNLASIEEFKNAYKSSIFSDLKKLVGSDDSQSGLRPEERVLKAFKDRLKVYSIERSRVIAIEFWANDRKIAQKVANTIGEQYLALQRKSKLETNASATGFLEPEINDLREKVRSAEAKVAEYRANSDILVGNNNALLATQQLSEVSTELSRVRSRRSAALARVESIRETLKSGASLDSIPEVVASPIIQRLRERQGQLRAQISELSVSLLPAHPRLKALKSQVSDFRSQIRRETRSLLKSLENNVNLTTKQENSILQELNRLKAEASRAGEAEVELRALEREAASERELLQAYLTRFREAVGRQSSNYQPINARIISRAPLATDSFYPKTVPFAIAASIVAGVLSVIFILAATLLGGEIMQPVNNHRPEERNDVSVEIPETGDIPTQVTKNEAEKIPRTASPPKIVTPQMANSFEGDLGVPQDIANEFDALESGSQITIGLALEGLKGADNSRIAVVSPGGDAGSITTWLLARNLANNGNTVAVIDMTGTGITSAHMLGSIKQPGIRDVMAGNAEFEDIIFRDIHSSVAVLPVGISQPRDIDTALERLAMMAQALEANYEYLIIDCGMTDINGVERIANQDTIVIVSAPGCDNTGSLENELINNGFIESISVKPSKLEISSLENLAA